MLIWQLLVINELIILFRWNKKYIKIIQLQNCNRFSLLSFKNSYWKIFDAFIWKPAHWKIYWTRMNSQMLRLICQFIKIHDKIKLQLLLAPLVVHECFVSSQLLRFILELFYTLLKNLKRSPESDPLDPKTRKSKSSKPTLATLFLDNAFLREAVCRKP